MVACELEAAALAVERGMGPACEPRPQPVEPCRELREIRDDEARSRGRGRGADVRDEIRQRGVLLMADGRDDRDGTVRDRAHEPLVAEGEQIFEAPSAAGEDDDVDLGSDGDLAQGFTDGDGGARSLDVRLGDEKPRRRKAGRDGRQHVPLGGRVVPGHEPDPARDVRELALPLLGEQSFGRELALEALQRREMLTEAEALDRERAEAEVPSRLEELGPAEHVDTLAVCELEAKRVELAARHRHGQAGTVAGILERQEDALPPSLAAELGHLAFDPDGRQAREPARNAAVEGRDRVDTAIAVFDCLQLHGTDATSWAAASRAAGPGRRGGVRIVRLPARFRSPPGARLAAGGGWTALPTRVGRSAGLGLGLEQNLGGRLRLAALPEQFDSRVEVGPTVRELLGQRERIPGLHQGMEAPTFHLLALVLVVFGDLGHVTGPEIRPRYDE